MGHDYIDFEDRHVQLNDFDIWVLRHIFLHVSTESGHEDLQTDITTLYTLRDFLESWKWYGPGTFEGTDLGLFVGSDSSRIMVLRALLKKSANYVNSFGQVIPLDYLQKYVNTDNAYFTESQPTKKFLDAISKITSILEEEE